MFNLKGNKGESEIGMILVLFIIVIILGIAFWMKYTGFLSVNRNERIADTDTRANESSNVGLTQAAQNRITGQGESDRITLLVSDLVTAKYDSSVIHHDSKGLDVLFNELNVKDFEFVEGDAESIKVKFSATGTIFNIFVSPDTGKIEYEKM